MYLLDDPVRDVVLVKLDQRVHEPLSVGQQLLLRRFPVVVHLARKRRKMFEMVSLADQRQKTKSVTYERMPTTVSSAPSRSISRGGGLRINLGLP